MNKVVLTYADTLVSNRPIYTEPNTSDIHALLERKGIEVWSLYNKNLDELKKEVRKIEPDFLGFAIDYLQDIGKLLSFLRELRSEGLKFQVIAYGMYPNKWADYLAKKSVLDFDYLIKGEPAIPFYEIVNGEVGPKSKDQIYVYNNKHIMENIDILPNCKNYMNNELKTRTSMGCPHNCLFCEERSLYKKYRHRSVGNVINEIECFINNNEFTASPWIWFGDLDFLAVLDEDKDWMINFINEIKMKKLNFKFGIQTRTDRITSEIIESLKSIGLSTISLGIETGSRRILEVYNKTRYGLEVHYNAIKILQQHNIPINLNFIMYEPTTTMNDIKENISFFKKINFPKGTIITHAPVSCYEKLIIFMDGKAYNYYKNIPGVNLREENYLIKYDFVNKDVESYYNSVLKWRQNIKSFLANYYMVLHHYMFNDKDEKEQKNGLLKMKILQMGNKMRKLDLQFMEDLIDTDDPLQLISDTTLKVDRLQMDLDKLLLNEKIDISELAYRGWHANLNFLLK